MSEWVIDNDEPKNNTQKMSSSDWEISPEENESSSESEGFGQALKNAPGRIVSDIGNSVASGLNAIPGYINKAKTEIPGALATQFQHLPHALGQLTAGLAEQGQNFFNMPHDLVNYATNRLHIIPQDINQKIQMGRMPDSQQQINATFGQPKYPGEDLIRGEGRNSQLLSGAGKFVNAIKAPSLFTTKKAIKNTILDQHDALENRATNAFKQVSSQVNARGIDKIPFNSNVVSMNGITSPKTFFEDIKDYFPTTKQSSTLINNAKKGDYNALRKLQTDLYTRAKKNLGSDLEADRNKGAEMMEKRNDINQTISNHLRNTGNYDLDELLGKARDDWGTLQKTYYNENMNNALIKMVNNKIRKVPNNLTKILSEESIPMQNLRDFHLGLEDKLNGYRKGQTILGKGFKYGLPAATAYLGYEYGRPGGNH